MSLLCWSLLLTLGSLGGGCFTVLYCSLLRRRLHLLPHGHHVQERWLGLEGGLLLRGRQRHPGRAGARRGWPGVSAASIPHSIALGVVASLSCSPHDAAVPLPAAADAAAVSRVCKTGGPTPFSTTKKNVIIMGDSVSIGYTPFVAPLLTDIAQVQHSYVHSQPPHPDVVGWLRFLRDGV